MNSDNKKWESELSELEFQVLRLCGTEKPFSGKYNSFYDEGTYHCAGCKMELFSSDTKFDSGSGWPSFYDVLKTSNVKLIKDNSHGMTRIEVRCNGCDGHLGHVFNDGPMPTGLRYCINSIALKHSNCLK